MRVERDDNEYRMRAEVYPFEDSQIHITISRERDWINRSGLLRWDGGASINWSALGSQDTETARVYAEALLKACHIADEMNAVPDHEHTTPDGYMVLYQNEETGRTMARRIENGEDVPMYDGWRVGKMPAAQPASA